MLVTLSPHNLEMVEVELGHRRWCATNFHKSVPFSEFNHMWGTRGEFAFVKGVAKSIGLDYLRVWNTWDETHAHRNLSELPDVETDFGVIDTKTIDQNWKSLMVPAATSYGGSGLKDGWAYVLVDGSRHPVYELKGWAYGKELRASGRYWQPQNGARAGRPDDWAYSLKQNQLPNGFSTLLQRIKEAHKRSAS